MPADPFQILQQNQFNLPKIMGAAREERVLRLKEMMLHREAERDEDTRKALGAFAGNPDDTGSLATIMSNKPEVALKLSDFADKRSFGRAFGRYLEGQPGVLSSMSGGRPATNPQQQSQQPAQPDFSMLGAPKDAADDAFLRMLKIDPEKALKIDSRLRDNFRGRLKAERDLYEHAVQELSRVQDDAGWQMALQRLAPQAQAMGVNILDHVPERYPGPRGVRALMEKAVPIKDQLAHILRQANIDADNVRADRATDSLIADRDARRGETRRYHDQRDHTTRRGQDLRGSGRGGGRDNIVSVKTPEEAMKLAPGTHFRTPDGRVKVR